MSFLIFICPQCPPELVIFRVSFDHRTVLSLLHFLFFHLLYLDHSLQILAQCCWLKREGSLSHIPTKMVTLTNVCLKREAVQLELGFKSRGISYPCSASPSNPFSQGFSAVIFFDCRSGWNRSATFTSGTQIFHPLTPRLLAHTHTRSTESFNSSCHFMWGKGLRRKSPTVLFP